MGAEKGRAAKAELKVDGKPIPLNPYVERVFVSVVTGLVGTLKNVPQPATKVELTIAP